MFRMVEIMILDFEHFWFVWGKITKNDIYS